MAKIKKRKNSKDFLYNRKRANEIYAKLNSCFEEGSIDEKDAVIILDWVCGFFGKRELIYNLERKKQEEFK